MAGISRRLLVLAIATRLVGVSNATGYLGQIGAMYGLPGVENTPAEPPAKSDKDLRVRPYFILEPSIGRPGQDGSLAGLQDSFRDLDLPFTVRAAGGDAQDVLALVDRIDALLFGWTPVVDGVQCGPLAPQPGYDPPLLPDTSTQPARFFTPLQYRFPAFT